MNSCILPPMFVWHTNVYPCWCIRWEIGSVFSWLNNNAKGPQSKHRTELSLWCRALYFVSPRERQWRQCVVQNKPLVIACVISVCSHAIKKESLDWRTINAFCRFYPLTHGVTSRSFSKRDKVYTLPPGCLRPKSFIGVGTMVAHIACWSFSNKQCAYRHMITGEYST